MWEASLFWWERPPGRDGFWLAFRGGAAAPTNIIPRHSRSPVIPAKAGIHRTSRIVARLVCSLGYRLDPRLREDDGYREGDDGCGECGGILVGAPAWARWVLVGPFAAGPPLPPG